MGVILLAGSTLPDRPLGEGPYYNTKIIVCSKIDEQIKLYAVCSQDLNEIKEQLSNMEENDDNYDMIAPNTQNIELQDDAEGAQDLHPGLTESCDLSEDIGFHLL